MIEENLILRALSRLQLNPQLEMVPDSFPKYVLSPDKGFETESSGIKWMNIVDFLLDTSW